MNQWKFSDTFVIGLMMFSIFFGAGNLIFPAALGQASGHNMAPAISGFLLTGIGLPFLGIVAIALQGGRYTEFISDKVHPKFALILLSILYLTIGPLFAVPRTGAVSFEIGIRPFLNEDNMVIGQAIYTGIFFLLTYFLALNPSKLVDRIGKLLTPVLLTFLGALFFKAFSSPLGDIMDPTGTYITSPFAQGFQDGYLTMDLLASLAVGSLVVNAIRMKGVKDQLKISKICITGGLLAISFMAVIYISLAYIGATSASVLGHSANGGTLLADSAKLFFGTSGSTILAVIIAFACLTTSCGMVSACSWFFNRTTNQHVSYNRIVLYSSIFAFVFSNVGLTELISISVPFLVAIYPNVIILVITSLFARYIGNRKYVYRCAIACVMPFCLIDGLHAAGLQFQGLDSFLTQYIPFYEIMLGWFLPALAGVLAGYLISLSAKGEAAPPTRMKDLFEK